MVAQARTWDIITEAQTVESFRHLRHDLDGIGRASYVCELVDAFSESDNENQPLWELMLLALRELDQLSQAGAGVDPQILLRWFELHLLSLSGFQPQLFTCLGCGREITPVVNFLSLAEGGIFCPECGQTQPGVEAIEPEVLKVLRHLQRSLWLEVRRLSVRPQVLRRVENILYRYLLTVLERQLRSTDFLRRLQAMQAAPPDTAPAAP
jgi:DNA repair protein RecO (recombination protein O)